jgi:small-conductance mechanosensitive channel
MNSKLKSILKGVLILLFKTLPWVILGIIAYLWYHGDLNPLIKFLDNKKYSLKIISPKLTPYKIIKGAIAIIYTLWLASIISSNFAKYFAKLKTISIANRTLITKGFSIFTYFLAFIFVLDILGLDLTALAVFSGAIGIGLGFGLQKITSNFISGLILLLEKSIVEGDFLELQSGGSGFVRSVGARHTLLETFDGKEIMIPNEEFITNRVTNCTHSNKMGRIDITIGVSYESDIKRAKELMLEIAKKQTTISKEKLPDVFLKEFADSSINFVIHIWLDDITDGKLTTTDDILFEIWERFKQENIEIPYPHRTVRIVNNNQ